MKKSFKYYIIFILVFLLTPLIDSQAFLKEAPVVSWSLGSYQPNEVIIKFKSDVATTDQVNVLSRIKHHKLTTYSRGSYLLTLVDQSVEDTVRELNEQDEIEYAEPNFIARAFFVPNDPYYSYQWNFEQIKMPQAWEISAGNDVVVAVVDTGVAYESYWTFSQAPDLKGTQFVSGYDFVDNDDHPNDANGHGTHIAGTIAQATNNKNGVAGIAYLAKIMPVRVLDKSGAGTYSDVAQGIRWAVDHGAKIINLSLGGPYAGQALEEAVNYAANKQVLVIAASGNDGAGIISYPAAYDASVVAVAAVRFDKARAYYSNWGESVDVVAPGGDLKVDQNKDGYGDGILQQTFASSGRSYVFGQTFGYYFFQGTSMAAAHVSGLSALIMAKGLNNISEVKNLIFTSAEDLGDPGYDFFYGHGLINAAAALANLPNTPPPEPTLNQLPSVKISGPAEGQVGTELTFDGSLSNDPDGQIVDWQWDFGDGTTGAGQLVKHTYNQPGDFTVSLQVKDNQGGSAVANTTITIASLNNRLSLTVKFQNSSGQEVISVRPKDKIYAVISAFLDGQPVKYANLEVTLIDPSGSILNTRKVRTNSSGQYKFNYRVQKIGEYLLRTKLSYSNFTSVVREDNFWVAE